MSIGMCPLRRSSKSSFIVCMSIFFSQIKADEETTLTFFCSMTCQGMGLVLGGSCPSQHRACRLRHSVDTTVFASWRNKASCPEATSPVPQAAALCLPARSRAVRQAAPRCATERCMRHTHGHLFHQWVRLRAFTGETCYGV